MPRTKIWTRRGGDHCVATVSETLHKQHRGQSDFLAFAEGPLQAGFLPTEAARLDIAWHLSWQIRLFRADWEFTARRLDFAGEGDWLLRFIASDPPDDQDWSDGIELDEGVDRWLVLTGRYIQRPDGLGQDRDGWAFREERYSKATLDYPPPTHGEYQDGDYARLRVHVHPHDHGDLVRWCGIEPFAVTSGD